jgi:hypothetical protein
MTALTEPVHRAIATRLRRGQTADQLYSVGERTDWWTADDVDWATSGGEGPRPDGWTLEQAEPTAGSTPAPAIAAATATITAAREAIASTALDGDTYAVDAPAAASQPLTVDVGEVVPGAAYVGVVRTDQVFADARYQRPLQKPRAAAMAKAWNPRMVAVIDVSDRGPGTVGRRFAVVNGQHRWAAAQLAGVEQLAATIHEGLDLAGEAALMHQLDQTTKKLSGHDQWRARRAAGDEAVLAVEQIAARHGLRVDSALADGVLRSYGAAEKLWRAGTLDTALGVLIAAYGTAAAGTQAPLLTAVGALLQLHPDLDVARLVRALAGARPEQLRATATALREVESGPLHELMARAVAGAYNKTAGAGGRIAGGRA